MKKFNRRERKIYKQGKAAGYAEGYLQGLHDGNPFIILGESVAKIVASLGENTTDPVIKALKEAAELDAEENGGELLGLDHDLIISDEIKPEDPPTK